MVLSRKAAALRQRTGHGAQDAGGTRGIRFRAVVTLGRQLSDGNGDHRARQAQSFAIWLLVEDVC